MTPRHEVFTPAAGGGWDVVAAEDTADFAHGAALLHLRLTEDENACLQAVVSFTVAQGAVMIDFSRAAAIVAGARYRPVRIERRALADKLPEPINPVQVIHPGTPREAMGGLYLLSFALPVREADTVTLELSQVQLDGRHIVVPPASFVRQGVSRSERKACA